MQSFIKNHQMKKEYGYYNSHRSASRLDGHKALRFPKCHKRSGASRGLNAKQFDVSRRNYCKHFRSHTGVPYLCELPHTVWGFGHHLSLGGNQKFMY